MSKHTPGPWFVDQKEAWVTQGTRDKPIAALLWPTELRSEEETKANANLIAIAPELLQGCIEVVRALEALTTKQQRGFYDIGLRNALEAIAKATGDTS